MDNDKASTMSILGIVIMAIGLLLVFIFLISEALESVYYIKIILGVSVLMFGFLFIGIGTIIEELRKTNNVKKEE